MTLIGLGIATNTGLIFPSDPPFSSVLRLLLLWRSKQFVVAALASLLCNNCCPRHSLLCILLNADFPPSRENCLLEPVSMHPIVLKGIEMHSLNILIRCMFKKWYSQDITRTFHEKLKVGKFWSRLACAASLIESKSPLHKHRTVLDISASYDSSKKIIVKGTTL